MDIFLLTEEDYENFAFMIPDDPIYHAPGCLTYGAVMDGKPVGVLVTLIYNGQAGLVWVYVCPDFRRQGVGRAMLSECVSILTEAGVWFLIFEGKINETARSFLEANDFLISEPRDLCRLDVKEVLEKGVIEKKIKDKPAGIVSLADVDKSLTGLVRHFILSDPYGKAVFDEDKICQEGSFIGFDDAGSPDACLLTSIHDRDLCIDLIHSDSEGSRKLIYLIYHLLCYARGLDLDNVVFLNVNPKSAMLAEYMTGCKPEILPGPDYGLLMLRDAHLSK